jgi:hypothetical protein
VPTKTGQLQAAGLLFCALRIRCSVTGPLHSRAVVQWGDLWPTAIDVAIPASAGGWGGRKVGRWSLCYRGTARSAVGRSRPRTSPALRLACDRRDGSVRSAERSMRGGVATRRASRPHTAPSVWRGRWVVWRLLYAIRQGSSLGLRARIDAGCSRPPHRRGPPRAAPHRPRLSYRRLPVGIGDVQVAGIRTARRIHVCVLQPASLRDHAAVQRCSSLPPLRTRGQPPAFGDPHAACHPQECLRR